MTSPAASRLGQPGALPSPGRPRGARRRLPGADHGCFPAARQNCPSRAATRAGAHKLAPASAAEARARVAEEGLPGNAGPCGDRTGRLEGGMELRVRVRRTSL